MVAKIKACFHGHESVVEYEPLGGRILVDVAKNMCIFVEKHRKDFEKKYIM